MNPEITETIITGMTKGELVAVILGTLMILGLGIAILGYLMQLHLKPLKDVPNQLSEIKSKIKTGSELNLMIQNQIQNHELNCPVRMKAENKSFRQ